MYTQAFRQLAITTPLGPDALLLTGFRGRETLSRLFHFELDLLALPIQPVPFEQLLGQSVTVRLDAGGLEPRYFNGIIKRFTQRGRDEQFRHYRAEVVPSLWLWTRKRRSRIFQQLSVPDIVRNVLYGLKANWDLLGDFAPRDYCVQYRETDFDFVSRLLEEEGIRYFFEHASDSHTLIVSNQPRSAPVPVLLPYVFDDRPQPLKDQARISVWEKSQELCSGKYTLRDYSFELPEKRLEASQLVLDQVAVGQVTHGLRLAGNDQFELYDFPGASAQRFDGVDPGGGDRSSDLTNIFDDQPRTAKLRIEEEAARSFEIKGQSTYRTLLPGKQFSLVRHFDADGDYQLTHIEHEAKLSADFRSGDSGTLEYTNRFTCLPKDLPYRPARTTPKPVIAGTQTALVVGKSGDDLCLDKYGRVKVQFYWDREGQKNADSSCWLRVAQVWAGRRWGAFFWPRVGHEVVVSFEEGDPDQPLVVGSVYNAANMPPLELPAGLGSCGFKSCTVGGDPSEEFNNIVFHDQPDDEHVEIHSQTHEVITSESSKFTMVPGPRFEFVGITPIGAGSGGGGGGFSLVSPPPALTPSQPVLIGSGGGGGITEIPTLVGLIPGLKDVGWVKTALEWWAANVPGSYSLTTGDVMQGILGGRNTHIFGPDVRMVADPEDLTYGRYFATISTLKGGIGAALATGVAGGVTLICGSNSSFTYGGPNLSVRRAENYTVTEDAFWKTTVTGDPLAVTVSKAVRVITLLTVTVSAVGHLLARILCQPDPKKAPAPPELASFIFEAVYSRLVALLITLETKYAQLQKVANDLKAQSAKDIKDAADALARLEITAMKKATSDLEIAERRLTSAAATVLALATGAAEDAGSATKRFSSNFSLSAQDISINSSTTDDAYSPSNITLRAAGGKIATPGNGSFRASGTLDAVMEAGSAQVRCVSADIFKGQVGIDGGMNGEITVHAGVGVFGPTIKVDGQAETIKLSVGPPVGGSSITLATTGITLQFGLFTLVLNSSGIKLTVGTNSIAVGVADIKLTSTPSTITIAPQEVNLTAANLALVANLLLSIKATQVQENVTATKMSKEAMAMYG